MPIEIIKESYIEDTTSYSLSWRRVSDPNSGYGFDCDKDGNVLIHKLNESSRATLKSLQERNVVVFPNGNEEKFTFEGVLTFPNSYRHPHIGRCHCGREIALHGFTNTCKCGRDYNSSGQLLAPRSQWGEETGESVEDILSIP